jgi:hypothetical protein
MDIQSIKKAYGINVPKLNQKEKKQDVKKTLEKIDVYEPSSISDKFEIDEDYFNKEEFNAKWEKFINEFFN